MCSRPAPLHYIIITGPFTKWGVEFMDCNLALAGGHHHIIVAVDYFKKWAKAMPTRKYDGEIATHFIFNQIITSLALQGIFSLTMAVTFRIK